MKGSHEGTPDHPDGPTNTVEVMANAGSTENIADSASGSPVDDGPSGSTPHASGEESDSEESSNSEFSHTEVSVKPC